MYQIQGIPYFKPRNQCTHGSFMTLAQNQGFNFIWLTIGTLRLSLTPVTPSHCWGVTKDIHILTQHKLPHLTHTRRRTEVKTDFHSSELIVMMLKKKVTKVWPTTSNTSGENTRGFRLREDADSERENEQMLHNHPAQESWEDCKQITAHSDPSSPSNCLSDHQKGGE